MANFSNDLAVVIGINDYGNGISSLQTAVNDAKALTTVLEKDHGYQVLQLVNEKATLAEFHFLLEKVLPESVQGDSRLLFYFAGHGIALNGEDGPEGYLIPQDAKLGDTGSYLSMPTLQAALSALPCRHFLGILDCCFAGAFRWSSTRDIAFIPEVIHQERYDRFIQDAAWQTITSAAHDQKALDAIAVNSDRGEAGDHSPFAAALIEALSGKADAYPPAADGKPSGDGVITATELYLYLRDRVEPVTASSQQRQTPGIWPLKKHDKGEYIFLSPGHALNLPPAPPLDESKNPYRGLESYDEAQSDLFFGRGALTEKLTGVVSQQPLTVVLGASGSGKSSVVKAGLMPALRQESAHGQWHVLSPMRPGDSPFQALGKVLRDDLGSVAVLPASESENLVEMLGQYLAIRCRQEPSTEPRPKVLLVIDQCEELITLCSDGGVRDRFLNGLSSAIATYPEQLHVVLTLRSDFEPQFQDTALKNEWRTARFMVPAMTRSELRETIEEPASLRVIYFQSDDPKNPLVDQLIDEVAEMPGALPLLSFTLSELYLKYLQRQKAAQDVGESIDRAITEADYVELGGVARSLTLRADSEYEALVAQDPNYAATIRNVMLRMVAVGGGELARRRVPLSEFEYPATQNKRVKTVIRRFSEARLLVEGQDPTGKPYAEPAHDELVRGWKRLLMWKQAEEESILLQRRLTPAAEEWTQRRTHSVRSGLRAKRVQALNFADKLLSAGETGISNLLTKGLMAKLLSAPSRHLGRSRSTQSSTQSLTQSSEQASVQAGEFLWNANPYLAVLQRQLAAENNWLNQVETDFVQESLLQKRRNISWRWRIAVGVMAGLSALTISALAGQRQAQLGQVRAFQQSSEANLLSDQELDALIDALRAGNTLETLLPFGLFKPAADVAQVTGALSKALQNRERARFDVTQLVNQVPGATLSEVFFDREGRLIAKLNGPDDGIIFGDMATQELLGYTPERKDSAFMEIALEDLSPEEQALLAGYMEPGARLTLSPQRDLLVISISIGTGTTNPPKKVIFKWTEGNREKITSFFGWDGVALSDDGQSMVTVDREGMARIWDVADDSGPTAEAALPTETVPIPETLRFSDYLASAEQAVFEDIKAYITDDLMAGTFASHVVDEESRETLIKEMIDTAFVVASPDETIVSILFDLRGNDAGRVFYFWDLAANHALTTLSSALKTEALLSIDVVRFSPNGQYLAIADRSNLRLWDLEADQWLETDFQGDLVCNSNVQSVVFSPDNQLIGTGTFEDDQSYVCVRDWAGYQLGKFKTESWGILSFTQDSNVLVDADYDGNVTQSWKVESLNELMVRGCGLVDEYLRLPGADVSEGDRMLCD